jgi:hypothetical protein
MCSGSQIKHNVSGDGAEVQQATISKQVLNIMWLSGQAWRKKMPILPTDMLF